MNTELNKNKDYAYIKWHKTTILESSFDEDENITLQCVIPEVIKEIEQLYYEQKGEIMTTSSSIYELKKVNELVNKAYDILFEVDEFGFSQIHDDRENRNRTLTNLNDISKEVDTALANLLKSQSRNHDLVAIKK